MKPKVLAAIVWGSIALWVLVANADFGSFRMDQPFLARGILNPYPCSGVTNSVDNMEYYVDGQQGDDCNYGCNWLGPFRMHLFATNFLPWFLSDIEPLAASDIITNSVSTGTNISWNQGWTNNYFLLVGYTNQWTNYWVAKVYNTVWFSNKVDTFELLTNNTPLTNSDRSSGTNYYTAQGSSATNDYTRPITMDHWSNYYIGKVYTDI